MFLGELGFIEGVFLVDGGAVVPGVSSRRYAALAAVSPLLMLVRPSVGLVLLLVVPGVILYLRRADMFVVLHARRTLLTQAVLVAGMIVSLTAGEVGFRFGSVFTVRAAFLSGAGVALWWLLSQMLGTVRALRGSVPGAAMWVPRRLRALVSGWRMRVRRA